MLCTHLVVHPAFHSCLSAHSASLQPLVLLFTCFIFSISPSGHPNEMKTLHWHKHSSSIVLIIATVTANRSLAVLTFVSSLVEEPIQQQSNLTNSINSVAAQQPMRNTERVCLPVPILAQSSNACNGLQWLHWCNTICCTVSEGCLAGLHSPSTDWNPDWVMRKCSGQQQLTVESFNLWFSRVQLSYEIYRHANIH